MSDHLEHRQIRVGVAVGIRRGEVVPLILGELAHRIGLARTVGVEEDLTGVLAVFDDHLGADGLVHPEPGADRLNDLGTGRGDDDDVAARLVVLGDQFDRLLVDDGVDDPVEGLGDDRSDLIHIPALGQFRQVDTHPFHLVVIGARGEIHELGVGALQHV